MLCFLNQCYLLILFFSYLSDFFDEGINIMSSDWWFGMMWNDDRIVIMLVILRFLSYFAGVFVRDFFPHIFFCHLPFLSFCDLVSAHFDFQALLIRVHFEQRSNQSEGLGPLQGFELEVMFKKKFSLVYPQVYQSLLYCHL